MPPQQSASYSLRDQVLTWLKDAHWEIDDIKTVKGYRWVVTGARLPGPYLSFGQPDGMPDCVMIQCQLPLSEESRNRLLQRSIEEQENFLWDLHRLLIATGTNYEFDSSVPTSIFIAETIYFDASGLTKARFMEGLSRIGGGVHAVYISLRRLMGCLRSNDPAGAFVN